ncbi:hypothetical protein VSS37_15310 [Candidatus Thiothrix sp. Deng01]|uniref:Uncharacterized protein n=1 Tax=Candidatus Thiothrix phosphatis TaxID=3112415 RepID=A0ABU6CZZ1_9GAMM|nr:hypothetical protein [Candidatus Thiothrix sp. Deng01]MEB4592355.1 hypothetical protein [Candidatus Thiothrix sp. Deng01]
MMLKNRTALPTIVKQAGDMQILVSARMLSAILMALILLLSLGWSSI